MVDEPGEGVHAAERLYRSATVVAVVVGGELARSSLRADEDSRSCELELRMVDEKDSGGERRLAWVSNVGDVLPLPAPPRGTSEKVLSAWTVMKLRRRDLGLGVEEVGEAGVSSRSSSSPAAAVSASAASARTAGALIARCDRSRPLGSG